MLHTSYTHYIRQRITFYSSQDHSHVFLDHHHFVTPKVLNPPNATAKFSYLTASQLQRNYIGPLQTVNFPLTIQRRGSKT